MLDPLSADWNQPAEVPVQPAVFQELLASIDFSRLNTLFDNFLDAIGVSIAIVDLQGKVLASSKWQRACVQFHRQADITRKRCHESDVQLSKDMLEGKNYAIYQCRNGLTDCTTPLIIEQQHVANLFIGQFFLAEPDLAFFQQQQQQAGFDADDYQAALAEVPIVDENKLPALLQLLVSLAQQIAELSMANRRNLTTIASVEQKINDRTQALQLQNQVLSAISHGESLSTVLTMLARQVELLHPGMLCSILLLDQQVEHLIHGAAPSLPAFYTEALNGTRIGSAVGSCGAAAFSGELVIVEDIHTHPNWAPYRALAQQADLRCCWSMPFKNAEAKVLGTFAVYQREVARPDKKILQLLTQYSNLAELAVSRQISIARIQQLAFYDSLTGLPNRSLFEERLQQAMADSRRNGKYCALMFLDLDNFKPVNDRYGHKYGDVLLKEAARRLKHSVREVDTVVRFGGDEFIVLLKDIDKDDTRSKQHAQQVGSKIAETLNIPYLLDDNALYHQCGCSIGILLFRGDDCHTDELLRRADAAMYQAKSSQQQLCWVSH